MHMNIVFDLSSIFLLGLIGGAIPGAILTSAFTEVIRKGFVRSLRVVLYAGISEVLVASCILFTLFAVHIPQEIFYAVSLVGSGVLLWIAMQIWSIKKLHDNGRIFDFKKIFLLTITNGPLWIFWSTICVPQAYLLSKKIQGGQIIFLIAFEAGWFAATLILTFLFSRCRPLLIKEGIVSKVFKFFAIILFLLALKLVLTSLFFFFQ